MCEACATYNIKEQPACDACGHAEEAKSRSLGLGAVALVGVGYLATLAAGVHLFQTRQLVGFLAAMVAIALSRILPIFIKPTAVEHHVRG